MTTGRERNPRGHGALLRAELLAAVDRLVGDEVRTRPGWLSLREAAREAGIAAPSIYPHFANKDELIDAAIAEGFTVLVESMRAAGEAGGDSPIEALVAQARAYCSFADVHRGFFRLMFYLGPSVEAGSGPSDGATALTAQWISAVKGLRGMDASKSDEQIAAEFWSSVHGQIALGRALRTDMSDLHAFIDTLAGELAR